MSPERDRHSHECSKRQHVMIHVWIFGTLQVSQDITTFSLGPGRVSHSVIPRLSGMWMRRILPGRSRREENPSACHSIAARISDSEQTYDSLQDWGRSRYYWRAGRFGGWPAVGESAARLAQNLSRLVDLALVDNIFPASFADHSHPMPTDDGVERDRQVNVLCQKQFPGRHYLIGE